MRTLHVAALAFPTQQGTQAALHAMLEALAEAGHETHLLCYAERAFSRAAPYRVHRVPALVHLRSLRSGPSAHKLLLDTVMIPTLRRLVRQLAPDYVVAHHVEAAAAVWAAGIRPWWFVAHTSLRTELPSYFAPSMATLWSAAGEGADQVLSRLADRTLAISPLLAELLSAEPLTIPWRVPAAIASNERAAARLQLGLSSTQHVALYAGNLDAYQGIEQVLPQLAALASEDPAFVWLVATESSPVRLLSAVGRLGFASRVRVLALRTEADRRLAHAAADLALVPRAAAGGLPVKLLDALARGLPVLATPEACGGLPLPEPAVRVATPETWGGALFTMFRELLREAGALGRAHVASAHAPTRFVSELCAHLHVLG